MKLSGMEMKPSSLEIFAKLTMDLPNIVTFLLACRASCRTIFTRLTWLAKVVINNFFLELKIISLSLGITAFSDGV